MLTFTFKLYIIRLQGKPFQRLATKNNCSIKIIVQLFTRQLGDYFFMYFTTSASVTNKIINKTVSVIHITPNPLGVLTALTSLQPYP